MHILHMRDITTLDGVLSFVVLQLREILFFLLLFRSGVAYSYNNLLCTDDEISQGNRSALCTEFNARLILKV